MSVINQLRHAMFPRAQARAWHCLAGGPRSRFPSDCASPPPLPEQVPLLQVGGDVTVRRSFFGFHAYDINLGGDGIVDETSEWGSVGADGKTVATQSDTTAVNCAVDSTEFPGGPVGFWYDLESDEFLLDLYQGKHSANDPRVLAILKTLLQIFLGAPCSHSNIPENPSALKAADAELAEMIRRQAGVDAVRDLVNAPVPPSCRHPAGRLRGYQRDWGQNPEGSDAGSTSLDTKLAVFGDVTGDGRSDAVVPMACNAGGVSWPEFLLVYGPGTRLEGWYDLADITNSQEHEDVDSLAFRNGGVDVAFRSYEGAAFTMSTYRGRLTATGGKVDFSYDGPLTVDYDSGRSSSGGDSFGPGIVTGLHDASLWLRPAPTDFQDFIESEWSKLEANNDGCPISPTVLVSRYSHLGFASGDEGSCGGAAYLWYRTSQGWKVLMGYQDGPFCDDVAREPTLKAALTALGLSCYSQSGAVQHLGRWPASGE
jgi:hypothetical protein